MRRAALTLFALATTACASTGAVPRPFPTPGAAAVPPLEAPAATATATAAKDKDGYAIAGTALSFRGVAYRNGGSDPTGFDCSGLVWYVFGQHGLRVPRTVNEQYRAGSPIDPGSLRAGDLLFFDTKGAGATHVGIAIGGDEFVHAPNSTGEVRVERLRAAYWRDRFVGARRII